jgi:NADP-reducing hydrogenase subunit HndD
VFDTNTGADLTIMEEANEFVERVQNGGVLPMITSCSPGWVRFAEKNYGDCLSHLSSCKSPHQMFGAIIKSYYAEKYGIDRNKICTVSVMPCIAKKYECSRPEMEVDGVRDVDYVITTRELSRMIKQANIDFVSLEDSEFDDPMGEATGAGAIFGTTGGVMEAAIRTAVDTLEGRSIDRIEYKEVRGEKNIKEATLMVAGMEVKIAVASGLSNARKIMDQIRAGTSPYHFIEIMACPGGCIMGGRSTNKILKNKIISRRKIPKSQCFIHNRHPKQNKKIPRKPNNEKTIRRIPRKTRQSPSSQIPPHNLHPKRKIQHRLKNIY